CPQPARAYCAARHPAPSLPRRPVPDTALPAIVPQPRLLHPSRSALTSSAIAPTEQLSTDLAPEAYRLTVTAEGATLAAGSEAGLRNGRATWTQLLDHATTDDDGRTTVPGVVVEDEPRHAWRGLMVDCARHFTPVAELEKLIAALALHLTDDQGWRVEIHGWPRLIEVGATRPRTLAGHHRSVENSGGEPQWTTEPHSGHYTQEELRALVRYGADRGVTLVPEIDLPGH